MAPSVALVEVWVDTQPRESADLHYELHQDKTLIASKGIGWANTQADEEGRWGVSQHGADLEFGGEVRLPFSWECPPLLLTEQLATDSRNSWKHEEEIAFRLEQSKHNWYSQHTLVDQGPFAGRRGLGSFQPPLTGFPGSDTADDGPSYFKGKIRREYEITNQDENNIEISKLVNLVFEGAEPTPTLEMSGSGQFLFNAQEGVPEQLAMRMQCHWKKMASTRNFRWCWFTSALFQRIF